MVNIMIKGVKFMCVSTIDSLKMEKLNEVVINLARIDIMPIIIIISLTIHVLSLKSGLISVPNMKN